MASRWPVLVPLGTLTVSAASTTTLLSLNCGSLQGQAQGNDYTKPAVPGTPLRQITLINVTAATTAFLMPRGKTAAANPDLIIMALPPNVPVTIPQGQPFENGLLPENFCLDGSATCTVYGCGVLS